MIYNAPIIKRLTLFLYNCYKKKDLQKEIKVFPPPYLYLFCTLRTGGFEPPATPLKAERSTIKLRPLKL